jgi:ubiquinone/menaquinone biosynthesis C-methylase UbiE
MTTNLSRAGGDDAIQKHYREQAQKHGLSGTSTMEDETVRARELEMLAQFVGAMAKGRRMQVLDLGCGNGYALEQLEREHPRQNFTGVDFSEELLALAQKRKLRAKLQQGDARQLPFADASFDVVYTERCLINIMDWEGQQRGLREVYRVLKPGGTYLMIECFTDALDRLNRARQDCGLAPIPPASHNYYFERERFMAAIAPHFDVVDLKRIKGRGGYEFSSNFLSTHYFISRVLYPAVLKGELVRNAEFVKFFSFLPPIGDYAPLQALALKRKAAPPQRRRRSRRRKR